MCRFRCINIVVIYSSRRFSSNSIRTFTKLPQWLLSPQINWIMIKKTTADFLIAKNLRATNMAVFYPFSDTPKKKTLYFRATSSKPDMFWLRLLSQHMDGADFEILRFAKYSILGAYWHEIQMYCQYITSKVRNRQTTN